MADDTSPDRPVHAFTHAPHPDADLSASKWFDPDELHLAMLMQSRFTKNLRVIPIVNEDRVNPLDAARVVAQRAWAPAVNPENEVWLGLIDARAADLGARAVFIGERGNFSFSYQPEGDLSDHLRTMASANPRRRATDVSLNDALRALYLRPAQVAARRAAKSFLGALGMHRNYRQAGHAAVLGVDLGNPATGQYVGQRLNYLRALADQETSLSIISSPAARLVPSVDPFTHPEVLRLAASLTSAEWTRGPYPRGFARRVGEGLVPDEIRLRATRGGQASDTWFIIKDLRDRYVDEASLLHTTPALSDWLDAAGIRRRVEEWPWGQVEGPDKIEMHAVHLVLTLADFIRSTQERLRTLPRFG
jgi:hypothetical protein